MNCFDVFNLFTSQLNELYAPIQVCFIWKCKLNQSCDDQLFIKHLNCFEKQKIKRVAFNQAFDACRFLWPILIFVIYTHIIQIWMASNQWKINAYEMMKISGGAIQNLIHFFSCLFFFNHFYASELICAFFPPLESIFSL